MAAFHEVQFPTSISQGALGGMGFNTSVLELSSGYEHRNINWSRSRGKWDVKHGLKSDEQIEELIDFFAARFGRAYGFRFKDWIDFRVPRWMDTPGDMIVTPGDVFSLPVWFTTDGSTRTFQLTKTYFDTAGSYTRLIQKPVLGTLQLLNNGVQIFAPTDWTCDYTTGIVTLSAAIAATTGHLISGATEFDVPVRFDIDVMQAEITMVSIYNWPSITVIETREIA